EAEALAVLAQVGEAELDGVARAPDVATLAVDVDFAAVDRVSPENGARHLRSASSHQPGEAEDFAFAEGEADVLDRSAAIEADHAQHLLAAAPTFGPRDVAEFASDHQRDDP